MNHKRSYQWDEMWYVVGQESNVGVVAVQFWGYWNGGPRSKSAQDDGEPRQRIPQKELELA
jgi:hypothetical protein